MTRQTHESLESSYSPSVKVWQKTKFSDGVVVVTVALKKPPRPLRGHHSAEGNNNTVVVTLFSCVLPEPHDCSALYFL